MLIPCEECKKEISSQAAQCPNCGHSVDKKWARAHENLRESLHGRRISKPMKILLVVSLLLLAPVIADGIAGFTSDSDENVSAESVVQHPAPSRDPDAVPFSRIWWDISSKFGLSPELAQSMARKVRAEGHHCGDIHSYQNPEDGKYNLLCDGLAYVYYLTGKDGAWTTVTPDKDNPDRKNTRSAAQKPEASADPVRKTPKGREYRITEFALDSLDDKRILKTVDLMVDFVRDGGKKCDRVIVALLLPRASTASISCGEENKPSRDYNFRLAGDTLFFNRSTSD